MCAPWAQCASQSSKSKSVSFCRDERTANEYAFNYQIKWYLCAEYVLESSRQFRPCVSTLTHTHRRVSYREREYNMLTSSLVHVCMNENPLNAFTRTAATTAAAATHATCRKKHTIWLEEMDKSACLLLRLTYSHMVAATIERQTTTTKNDGTKEM